MHNKEVLLWKESNAVVFWDFPCSDFGVELYPYLEEVGTRSSTWRFAFPSRKTLHRDSFNEHYFISSHRDGYGEASLKVGF